MKSTKNGEINFWLNEYTALREEILKRLEFQYQLISFTLLMAGTLLTVGVQEVVSSFVLLIYPILAMFLAAAWAQNDLRVQQLGFYIREELERRLGMGWENFRLSKQFYSTWGPIPSLGAFAARGVFVTTQFLAILFSFVARFPSTTWECILLVFDLVAMVLTFLLVRRWRPKGSRFDG